MNKAALLVLPLLLSACLFGCAFLNEDPSDGLSVAACKDASVVLTYRGPKVIRKQSQVACLVVAPMKNYALSVDGISIKPLGANFNPNLWVSRTDNDQVFVLDMLPGPHSLLAIYDNTGSPGTSGSAQSSKQPIHTEPTEIIHAFTGGEIACLRLSDDSLSASVEITALPEKYRSLIADSRDKARF